jgi:hypothetical protein
MIFDYEAEERLRELERGDEGEHGELG